MIEFNRMPDVEPGVRLIGAMLLIGTLELATLAGLGVWWLAQHLQWAP